MTGTDRSFTLPADLTERELEVLRLLAAGHTAKTIAARLGRSETSINERLRTARRKTGVGSSRELARLLDAQKIWDKKIDLPGQGTMGRPLVTPAASGWMPSKGLIVMLITIPLAALGLIAVAPPALHRSDGAPVAADAARRPAPLVGTWSLDVARIPVSERPRQVTMTFGESPTHQWTTHVRIVGADGSVRDAESIAATDGVPVPVSGNMEFVDSVALRQPSPGTLVMTLRKNGAPFSTRVYTVAKDRKTMTETIVWPSSDLPKLETTYFTRVE